MGKASKPCRKGIGGGEAVGVLLLDERHEKNVRFNAAVREDQRWSCSTGSGDPFLGLEMLVGLTRRSVLGSGAGLLFLRLHPDASGDAEIVRRPEMFVFQAPCSGRPVFAALFPAIMTCSLSPPSSMLDVRFHAGEMSWSAGGNRSALADQATEILNARLFSGEVFGHRASVVERFSAAVVELPLGLLSTGHSLGVWAEAWRPDGSRIRIGSPFVANLLAGDTALSDAYNAASPAQDRALLAAPLERRIATLAAAGGRIADSVSYARRLAARLLPDVIPYRHDLPVGFNVASQNGRHPADDTASVVTTVTTDAVTFRARATRFPLSQSFPYFQPLGATA